MCVCIHKYIHKYYFPIPQHVLIPASLKMFFFLNISYQVNLQNATHLFLVCHTFDRCSQEGPATADIIADINNYCLIRLFFFFLLLS